MAAGAVALMGFEATLTATVTLLAASFIGLVYFAAQDAVDAFVIEKILNPIYGGDAHWLGYSSNLAQRLLPEGDQNVLSCPGFHKNQLVNPVIIGSGYTYEGKDIVRWLNDNGTCPLTNEETSNFSARANFIIIGLMNVLDDGGDVDAYIDAHRYQGRTLPSGHGTDVGLEYLKTLAWACNSRSWEEFLGDNEKLIYPSRARKTLRTDVNLVEIKACFDDQDQKEKDWSARLEYLQGLHDQTVYNQLWHEILAERGRLEIPDLDE
jgi:hypothetical protein